MKITPTHSKSTPVYPTLMAMVGAVLAGCDGQPAPGSVPYEEPRNEPEAKEQPEDNTTQPKEAPLKLGGEMPRVPRAE